MSTRNPASKFDILPSAPDESKRKVDRIDIREGDGVSASIYLEHHDAPIEVRVYDISLNGLSVVIPNSALDFVKLFNKQHIILKRSWADEVKVLCTCVWRSDVEKDGVVFKAGFRIDEHVGFENAFNIQILSNYPHFVIPNSSLIAGYVYKDILYSERTAVRITAIGRQIIQIEITDTAIFLVPEMKIELFLAVSTTHAKPIRGRIKAIHNANKVATVLIEIEPLSKKIERDLVAHLIYDTNVTPHALAKAGLKVKQVANNFRFRFVKNKNQYMEVLDLRFKAYGKASKLKAKATNEDMIAPLDKISRILSAFHGNKMVGCVAMAFPASDDAVIETETALGRSFPDSMPKKTNIIEIARLCVDPDYRKGDLLIRIFEQMYKVFATSDRQFLVTSTDKTLWPLYKSIGFKKTGLTYNHPYLNNIVHEIILVDRRLGFYAKDFNPLAWNVLYRNMNEFLKTRFKPKKGPFARIKILVMTVLGKILRIRTEDKY